MMRGRARISTNGQNIDAQVKQLRAAGAKKVWRETASGAKTDRAQLRRLLDQPDAGDLLQEQVAGVGLVEKAAELGAVGLRAARRLAPDLLRAGGAQLLDLCVDVLTVRRYPCATPHHGDDSATLFCTSKPFSIKGASPITVAPSVAPAPRARRRGSLSSRSSVGINIITRRRVRGSPSNHPWLCIRAS